MPAHIAVQNSKTSHHRLALGSGFAALAVIGLVLSGCSVGGKLDPFAGKGSPKYSKFGPLPKGGGRRHVGKPYVVAGQKFYPKEEPNYDRRGVASWYGPKFHRRQTANGEWFDQDYRSAAHTTLPLPSYARVTNLENGREMVVRINDRGPFVNDRIIDLSKKSAEILGFKNQGKANVRVQYLGPAPLNDKGRHLAAINKELDRGVPSGRLIAAADRRTGSRFALARPAQEPVPAPPVQPVAENGYFIQAGAYSDRDNAARAQRRLSPIGPVSVTPVSANFGTIYRVRLGPWRSRTDADNTLWRVQSAGHHDARIVPSFN